MNAAVANQANEPAFQQFLKSNQSFFPETNWKNCLQILANGYYLGVAKDTTGYLEFMTKHPVIYHYYYMAFYSNMLARKQDTPERCKLLYEWGDAVVDKQTSLDIIRVVAYAHKRAGDIEGYKKYVQMCISKMNEYNMPNVADFEKMLL